MTEECVLITKKKSNSKMSQYHLFQVRKQRCDSYSAWNWLKIINFLERIVIFAETAQHIDYFLHFSIICFTI